MISKNNTSHATNLSLDNICTLLSEAIEEDEIGNQISKYSEREIFCAELPVYSSEFYNASQQGIKIQKILVIDVDEYTKEEVAKYDGTIYVIFKTFLRSDGLLELYCSQKVGA